MKINYTRLSKTVAHALRHKPWIYEIELDEEGWTSVESLLYSLREGKKEWKNLSKDDFSRMILKSSKKRYEIEGDRIRALYGHSISNKIIKTEAPPPEFLFHGTSQGAYKKIAKTGLLPMSRQYVHFSIDTHMAYKVGSRKSKNPIILKILAQKAREKDIKFYKGNDRVWLSDFVPSEFIIIDNDRIQHKSQGN